MSATFTGSSIEWAKVDHKKVPHLVSQGVAGARSQEMYRRGAAGVVFRRNAIQVPNPIAFQQALCDVVKRGLAPAEAMRKYNLE